MAKILIIDDDVSIGNMIETALLKAGHEARRAYSGRSIEKNISSLSGGSGFGSFDLYEIFTLFLTAFFTVLR